MLIETGSNCRLNETVSASSVRTNAGSGNNALSALGCRLEIAENPPKPSKSAGIDCERLSFKTTQTHG